MQEKKDGSFFKKLCPAGEILTFCENVTRITRASEFKTVVKRWILSRSLLARVRPKSALNHRGPSKSINPGKYNDPRCGCRYKSLPSFKRRSSPIRPGSGELMVLARYNARCRAAVLYKSGRRSFRRYSRPHVERFRRICDSINFTWQSAASRLRV